MTTDPGDAKSPTEPDTHSDPALDDGDSSDWSSEGGATEHGPATDHDNDDPDEDKDAVKGERGS